jgi:hypothetical protein
VTCKHGPRQTINCQLHIVTLFVGPTQRIWSGAAALDGAQGLIFQASIQIPNHAAGVLIFTQGWSKQDAAWPKTDHELPVAYCNILCWTHTEEMEWCSSTGWGLKVVVQAFARIPNHAAVCSLSLKAAPNCNGCFFRGCWSKLPNFNKGPSEVKRILMFWSNRIRHLMSKR